MMVVMAFGKPKGSCYRKQAEAKRLSLDDLCVYKETPRQWMKQLLDAARMAPSSMNSQPWRFVVFDSRIHIFSKKHPSDKLGKWDEVKFWYYVCQYDDGGRRNVVGCGSDSSG